jgi:hypothetical protein
MTLPEALKRIEELEQHITRQNELIKLWMLRLAKDETKSIPRRKKMAQEQRSTGPNCLSAAGPR